MAVGDVIRLTKEDSKLVLVSLKTGRREEVGGQGSAVISAEGWSSTGVKAKRLPDMDVAFLNKSFSSKSKVREKLGEVVRTGASPIPVEARRPMGAIPPGPVSITLASWQGVQTQKVQVWEGDRTIMESDQRRGEKAASLAAGTIRPGFIYRWEVRIQTSSGVEKVSSEFWALPPADLQGFQLLLKESGLVSSDQEQDPDRMLAVVNRALELGMKGIALDLMSAFLVKNPKDELMRTAKEELIKELEAV